MYKLSRYWNRLAYFFIKIGRRMIWDYTGKNDWLLTYDNVLWKHTEAMMCDRK